MLKGFKRDLTFVFDKRDDDLKNTEYFNQLKDNSNTILLRLSRSLKTGRRSSQCGQHVLNTGYLNDRVSGLLEKYCIGER